MKELDALNFCFSKHLVDSHLPDATPECHSDETSLLNELPMSTANTTADSSMLSLTDVLTELNRKSSRPDVPTGYNKPVIKELSLSSHCFSLFLFSHCTLYQSVVTDGG